MARLTLSLAAVFLALSPMIAAPVPAAKSAIAVSPPRAVPATIDRTAFAARLDGGFRALDRDRDGKVSLREYRVGGLAVFARADRNRDGVVSAGEASGGIQRET